MPIAYDALPPIELPVQYFAPWVVFTILMTFGFFFLLIARLFTDKEFYYWMTRQDYIYSFFTKLTGTVSKLIILERNLDPKDKSFNFLGGTYYCYNTIVDDEVKNLDGTPKTDDKGVVQRVKRGDEKTIITQFLHRGHRSYYHSQGNPMPHGFVPRSLDAPVKAEAIFACKDGNIRRQIEAVKPGDKVQRKDFAMIFLIVVVIFILIFVAVSMNQNNQLLKQLQQLFSSGGSGTPTTNPTGPSGVTAP